MPKIDTAQARTTFQSPPTEALPTKTLQQLSKSAIKRMLLPVENKVPKSKFDIIAGPFLSPPLPPRLQNNVNNHIRV